MQNKNRSFILTTAILCVLLGRGIFLLLWDAPYRAIVWDEQLLSGIVNLFGDWESWVSSMALDQAVIIFTKMQGLTLLLTAGLLFSPWKKTKDFFLSLSSFHLLLLGFAGFWNAHHQWGYFFEYALQIAMPMAYILFHRSQEQRAYKLLVLSAALTFFGHGLYAIGYYMRPGRFFDMVIAILPVQEKVAGQLLFFAGVFDMLFFCVMIAALFFAHKIPRQLIVTFLCLACFWGFTTAWARWFAYVDWQLLSESLWMWGPQVVYRLVHGFAPLWLVLNWDKYQQLTQKNYQQTPRTASILSV